MQKRPILIPNLDVRDVAERAPTDIAALVCVPGVLGRARAIAGCIERLSGTAFLRMTVPTSNDA